MAVVLGLDQGQRQVALVEEDVVGPQLLAPDGDLAADDHAPGGEGELPPHLGRGIPPSLHEGRGDEVLADLGFVLFRLVHATLRRGAGVERPAPPAAPGI